jgi:hypothetical protein
MKSRNKLTSINYNRIIKPLNTFPIMVLFSFLILANSSCSSDTEEKNKNIEIEFRLEKEQNESERHSLSSKIKECNKCVPFNFTNNVYLINTSFDEINQYTVKFISKSTRIKKTIPLTDMDDEDFTNFNSFILSLNLDESEYYTETPKTSEKTEIFILNPGEQVWIGYDNYCHFKLEMEENSNYGSHDLNYIIENKFEITGKITK